jgi:hypothetical protein
MGILTSMLAFIKMAEKGASVSTLAERFEISNGSATNLFDELLLARKVTPRTNRAGRHE